MAGFIEGADRGQLSLLPGSLDDWVGNDNPVRVIDAFVDKLDLTKDTPHNNCYNFAGCRGLIA
jgi:hypothetical protein